MKLTNIGGATGILEHGGKRMLFDPWLDDGIFHGSWYHYPPAALGVEDLGRLDYVYISHIHEDHCSAGTIAHLNRDAEIILMDREPNYVARFLERQGFHFKKIHLVKPRTPTEIAPGLWVDMLDADPADAMNHAIDSALILRWDGFVIYNSNDCPPYADGLAYLRSAYPKVDLALLPYSGGSGYPACYMNLSDVEKAAEKQRILTWRMQGFVDVVKALDPAYAMPFADQYVVGGSRSHLNQYVSHPACKGDLRDPMSRAGVEDKLLLLNSGQSFDLETKAIEPDEPFRPTSTLERDAYVDSKLKDKLYDHERITFEPSVPLDRLVGHARERLWRQQEKEGHFPSFCFYLDASDARRRFRIDLAAREVVEVGWDDPLLEPRLRIATSRTLLIMLLIGHVSWNIADAGLFLDYERQPNVYDSRFYTLLNHLRM